jgi:hypothetical protein
MLKRLVMLVRWKYPVVIVLILMGSIYVTGKYQNASNQCEKECAQFKSGSVSPATRADQCDDCEKYSERRLPRWYKVFSWPEGITTWAILLTLMAIAEQTHQTRRAADSGAEAANAAYGSVTFARAQWELTKEKERARLDIQGGSATVEENDMYWHIGGTLRARNIGQSRAFIIESRSKLTVKVRDGVYPEYESYGQIPFADSFVDPEPSNDFATLSFTFYPDGEDKIRFLAEDLHALRRSLHLYGFVDYETLGMRFRKEFGFVWTVIDPAWHLGGLVGDQEIPTEAQKVTFGYWSVDSERNKPEYPISREQDEVG